MKFTHILFPVDFSDRCRSMAPQVAAAVKRFGAALTIVNFVDTHILWYGSPEAACVPDISIPGLLEEATERLQDFSAKSFPGLAPGVVVQEGDPGVWIAEAARVWGCDLIMLPTRGRGRFRSALLGSVTAKVLHDAECAVWTDAHTGSDEATGPDEWKHVVCAIDTTPEALRLIRYAKDIATETGAQVCLAHAIPVGADTGPEKYFDREFTAFLNDAARKTIAELQREAGTNFEVCIEAGKVSAVVAASAGKHRAGLAIVGRGTLPHAGGRLRTHVYGIIRDVACPVLSI